MKAIMNRLRKLERVAVLDERERAGAEAVLEALHTAAAVDGNGEAPGGAPPGTGGPRGRSE